jgi:hypothetical protein
MAAGKGGKPARKEAARRRTDRQALPVEPDRLRREFPALSDEDLAVYADVTRSVMALEPDARGARVRELIEKARDARAKLELGRKVPESDLRLVRYLAALEKMQGPAARPSH